MKVAAVLNRDGGTLRSLDVDRLCADLRAVFSEHGHELICAPMASKDVARELERASRNEDIDLMLAAGGDGTISTAARAAFEAEKPLAVLPAGTMNLFARSLGLPLDLQAAIRAVAGGEIGRIDIATANGVPFIHQFGVGVHARLVRIRDQMTYQSRMGKMLASVRALSTTVVDPPRFAVEIGTQGAETRRRQTSGIAISNNPFGEGHVPHADRLDGGVLGVYFTAPMSAREVVGLMIEVMLGTWHANPLVSELESDRVHLHFPKRKRNAQAVIDGELVPLERDVEIILHPRALQVMLPRSTAV